MTMAHDLLTDPLLSWRDLERQRRLTTLPGILAQLAGGELADFPRARAHQFHPWCMFLTQLAVIALRQARRTDSRLNEEDWRSLLLELTHGSHEPWCLLVDDFAKPAFLQPPVPERSIDAWPMHEHPDDLDVLLTAKNHDVKRSLVAGNDLEAWILALATLQTMQGYPGRGYNRIARMKGGYGSRARVGVAANRAITSRFLRDVDVMLSSWDSLLARGFNAAGLGLSWLAPWDGVGSLSMAELTPHFIEICWRVRCQAAGDGVVAAYTTTKNRRCLPEIDNGDAGDPWIPIEREAGALTVGRGGFYYQLLTRVLFDFVPAAAQVMRPSDGDPVHFFASVMARGQGKTEGLHDRALILSGHSRRALGQPDARAALGKRATENVQQAAKMRSKVLFPALKKISLGDEVIPDQFDTRVDEVFFDHLFSTLTAPVEQAQLEWDRLLREMARAELQRSVDRCCVPSARWYRAVSDAEGVFYGCLKKHFPTLMASTEIETPQGGAA